MSDDPIQNSSDTAPFDDNGGAVRGADPDAGSFPCGPDRSLSPLPEPSAARGPDSYRLAYRDENFLSRDELRPVRLQLELLKPELVLQDQKVKSTVVVFGSARVPEPSAAQEALRCAREACARAPGDPVAARRLARAERQVELSRYYEQARRFGEIASRAGQAGNGVANGERHYVVTTGGGPGLMEAANRGASDAGAVSIGFNIALPREQVPNPYVTPELCFRFHYFALRKMHLLLRARALVIFPGGFGTMDELFETLTLIQTGKIEPIPVLLFGERFWRGVIDFGRLAEEGMIDEADLHIFRFVETAEEAWHLIAEREERLGHLPPGSAAAIAPGGA